MVNRLPDGFLTSDFSLAENILRISWICEQETETEDRELKEPKYYLDEFYKIANNLKKKIGDGKDAEKIIREFIVESTDKLNIQDLITYPEKHKGTYLTNFLDFGKINCVCASGLFMGLAEMLDYELYERCYLGDLKAHSMVILKSRDGYKNIDYGRTIPDKEYLKEFNQLPEILPKKAIFAIIFYNKATEILNKANSKVQFSKDKDLLIAEDLYNQSLKIFDLGLKIYPYFKIKINKMYSTERLDFISKIKNYNQDFGSYNDLNI